MDDTLSKSERETLKAVFRLAKDGEGAHTGELAAHLGVYPGTATATVKRLAGRGLLDHKPYRGVELTRAGRREAAKSMRRHRIVERFLSDMLGYAWNEADRLAGSSEHDQAVGLVPGVAQHVRQEALDDAVPAHGLGRF